MMLKVVLLITCCAICGFAEPPPVYGPPRFGSSGYGKGSTYGVTSEGGYSGGEGGVPEPYSFQYEVKDAPSGNDYSHQASSDGRKVTGEYNVLLPDGRRQIVKYTADESGYKADVKYEGQAKYPQSSGGSGSGYGPSGGFGGYTY